MKILKPNGIAVKLGLIHVIIFMMLIFSIEIILYMLFIRFYTDDVISDQIKRTQGYATVLSDHFDSLTIEHLLLMENGTDNLLLILNKTDTINGQTEGISDLSPDYMKKITSHGSNEHRGPVLASNWKREPFFVTESYIKFKQQTLGRVLMFSPTEPIRSAAQTLKNMFIGVAIIVLIIGAIIIFLVSRRIVQPLLRMINITKQISEGNHDWELNSKGSDEIAQLSHSIKRMSDNIQFYKQQRKQFLADISHELRTPITYMKGYSEVLLKGLDSTEEKRQKYLKLLNNQSNQLQRLIDDLFELAKLEEGSFSITFNRTSIDKIMQNALGFMADSILQSGINISYNPSQNPLYVTGDERRLQQVVVNLLENARKYTPVDGTITISAYVEGVCGVIKIADTGIGIPKDELPHIWERLYRIDRSRSRATGGTGLGLAICKEIVELHHGSIKVESTEGIGATFFICIPLFHE